MIIAICSSMVFMDEILQVERELKSMGHEVYIPIMKSGKKETGEGKIQHNLIKEHFIKIDKSDCILVLNYDKHGRKNYIGGNTFLEMGKAFDKGIPIFLLNPVPEMEYKDELIAMQPIILYGDLKAIKI